MNLPRIVKPTAPAFTDEVLSGFQDSLGASFAWLNHVFGKVQTIHSKPGNRIIKTPSVHLGGKEYLELFPKDFLGNYSFFHLRDPARIDFKMNAFNLVETQASLIFWFNLDTIYPGAEDRNLEALKKEILGVLTRTKLSKMGRFEVMAIYETDIFKGFDLDESKNQYLMQPFAGLRFEGVLKFREPC